MSNWKVGDVAICVNASHLEGQAGHLPPLRLKAEYMVNIVKTCECGGVSLDVGLPLGESSIGVRCGCGATSSPKTGIWWVNAKRFAKKQTAEDSKEEEAKIEADIETALANEDYELAHKLQQNKL